MNTPSPPQPQARTADSHSNIAASGAAESGPDGMSGGRGDMAGGAEAGDLIGCYDAEDEDEGYEPL